MTTGSRRAAQVARELENELDSYPDDRGEILVEAGHAWHQAGDHVRAIALLTEATALGGDDGNDARVTLAEVLFDLDRAEEAWAQLNALRDDRPPSPGPYQLTAELLADRGDLQQALTWYNMAVSRLTDEQLAERNGESGLFSEANHILNGRRGVRRALELPADELDDSVHEYEGSALDPFTDPVAAIDHGARPPREVRVLFWPRDEVVRAHQRWPQLVEHDDVDAVTREREAGNRELSETGVARITMVPLTVASLADFAARTGGDPTDEHTRRACMDEIVGEGSLINWPPGRNAPCWCGSAVKYKKCCGRPI